MKSRPRGSRALRLLLWGVAAAHVGHGLVLRHRRNAITALPDPGPDAVPSNSYGDTPTVVHLRRVHVDDATLAAAAQEMESTGAQAVDLVPGDLPSEATLHLLNSVDPGQLESNPLSAPGGANHAVVVHPSVAARLGVSGTVELATRADMVRTTRRIQRYAAGACIVRVAPRLHAAPDSAVERWDALDEELADAKPHAAPAPLIPVGKLLQVAGLAAGVLSAPVAGAAAVVAWASKPLLVEGRSPGTALRRPLQVSTDSIADLAAGVPRRRAEAMARRDRVAPTTPPLNELFDPRRDTCPWCGSGDLTTRIDTTDLMQHKPGSFHLDECQACGHVFQNPALSLQGLDYYYDQFYDGVGAESAEGAFGMLIGSNEDRVEVMSQFHEPRAWLDVGGGIGQFCVVARRRWPEARFDVLDLSDSADEAERRGWVVTAYRGLFPEMADGLPRSYDVVSMHHYLEHTRDPRSELLAAAKVLEPGGYLLVEVPDAASPWARRLGRFWNSWFQPQHLHFVTCDNLVAALDDVGFEVMSVERGSASTGGDLILAPLLAVSSVAGPSPHMPWLPEPSLASQVKRMVAGSAGLAAAAMLLPLELAKEAYLHGPGASKPSNAIRVVARRR